SLQLEREVLALPIAESAEVIEEDDAEGLVHGNHGHAEHAAGGSSVVNSAGRERPATQRRQERAPIHCGPALDGILWQCYRSAAGALRGEARSPGGFLAVAKSSVASWPPWRSRRRRSRATRARAGAACRDAERRTS